MSDDIVWLDFDEVALSTGTGGGSPGFSLLANLEDLFSDFEGEYTVYWPSDGVRVFPQLVSYEVASFVSAMLRDERTHVYLVSAPTLGEPVIARPRRQLNEHKYMSPLEVKTPWKPKTDWNLSGDIWMKNPDYRLTQPEDRVYRLDAATIPR